MIQMKTSDFDYELPAELIAQTPIEPRDSSRLLVFDRISEKSRRVFQRLRRFFRLHRWIKNFNPQGIVARRRNGRPGQMHRIRVIPLGVRIRPPAVTNDEDEGAFGGLRHSA